MHLSQSVGLWQGRGGIQKKIGLFGKRPSIYYVKNSSNKQRETTVHHYFKTKVVNIEHFKNFESFYKCSRKNHQALWWNWLSRGPPQEKEDTDLPLLQISSLELPVSEIVVQINASQSPSNRHISTSTVQRRLWETGLHGRIAKKHTLWTSDQWKSVLWSDESKFEIFGSNCHVYVRCGVGERMISACVVPIMKHGGGGMMVWGLLCWWNCQWFI